MSRNHSVKNVLALKVMTSDFESNVEDVNNFDNGSIMVNWAGQVDGPAQVQLMGSDDPKTNFCPVAGGKYLFKADASGSKIYEFPMGWGWHYIRADFTSNGASSGTVTIKINKKNSRP